MTKWCHTPVRILGPNDKRYPDMNTSPRITVSAFPTVEWLQQRAADRGSAARHTLRPLPTRPSAAGRLLGAMRAMLDTSVRVEEGHWVATPDGELPVDIVLQKGDKRIGICCRSAWVASASDQDALMLVYGGFDVLYRCTVDASLESVVDAAYALMQAHPTWFSAFGRLSLGRRASDAMVASALCGTEKGWNVAGPFGMVEALRLRVASDWVRAFERALRGGNNLVLSA